MRTNKYLYERIIQQYFATCWEDVSSYECNSQGTPKEYNEPVKVDGIKRKTVSLLSLDLKDYKLMGYPTRVIFRKTLKQS